MSGGDRGARPSAPVVQLPHQDAIAKLHGSEAAKILGEVRVAAGPGGNI